MLARSAKCWVEMAEKNDGGAPLALALGCLAMSRRWMNSRNDEALAVGARASVCQRNPVWEVTLKMPTYYTTLAAKRGAAS